MVQERNIFIGYAVKEKSQLEQLKKQLTAQVKDVTFKVLDDTSIPANLSWRNDLEKLLHGSKVAIFLISPDFLSSNFIVDDETPAWLKRAETLDVQIYWVALKPCPKFHPLSRYPILNQPDQPLSKFKGAALEEELKKIGEKVAAEFKAPAEEVPAAPVDPTVTEPIPALSEQERLELLRDLGLHDVDEDGEQAIAVKPEDLELDHKLTQDERFEGYLRHLMRNERFLMFFKELVKVTDPKKVKDMGEKLGITPEWTRNTDREGATTENDELVAKTGYEETLRNFSNEYRLALRVGGHPERVKVEFEGKKKVVIGQSRSEEVVPDIDLASYMDKPYGVSRRHVQVWSENNRLCIQDLKSRNHTYINGEFLNPDMVYIVASGDKIRLGALLVVAHFEKIKKS